jgi:hypothetical protein
LAATVATTSEIIAAAGDGGRDGGRAAVALGRMPADVIDGGSRDPASLDLSD